MKKVQKSPNTLKYSAKLPTGKVITLDGNVLPIGLVGNYEVYVTAYNGENVTCGETTLPLVVNQMTVADYENSGIIATFGYDGSEIASYKVTSTDKATWKALNTAESIATETLSNGTQWTADWHAEYEGRYGVISTRAQIEADGAYGGNPIFLRSDIYHTTDVMLPYFGTKGSISNRKIAGIEYEGWDYISVWIYLPKENAVDGDYTEIWRRSAAGGAIQVPYNVWYELKIDKAYFINNYYERPGYVFRYGTGSYPLFFMSGKTDSTDENALERDQIIYVDGIRTAKYQG